MSKRCDAELTQIVCRQAGQGLRVYVVVAKHALVLIQPEAAQPIRYVHIDLPQERRRSLVAGEVYRSLRQHAIPAN